MKKTAIAAVIALMTLASCGNKTAENTNEKAEEAATEALNTANDAINKAADAVAEATGSVIELTDDEAYRPATAVETPVILDFNATWCGPCKMLTPVFKAAAEKYNGVKFVSVDIDKMTQTATAFGIEAVPTVVILAPGKEPARYVGTDDLLPAERFDKIVSAL